MKGPAWLWLDEKFWTEKPSKEELTLIPEVEVAAEVMTMPLPAVNEGDDVVFLIAAKTNSFDWILWKVRLVQRFFEVLRHQVMRKWGEKMPWPVDQERQ